MEKYLFLAILVIQIITIYYFSLKLDEMEEKQKIMYEQLARDLPKIDLNNNTISGNLTDIKDLDSLKYFYNREEVKTKKLHHKYSGKDSELFWNCVDAMGERRNEFYSLGVILQNIESWVLDQMAQEAPNFVEKN